jgi:hypothetical protein
MQLSPRGLTAWGLVDRLVADFRFTPPLYLPGANRQRQWVSG